MPLEASTQAHLKKVRELLEEDLANNVMPFWATNSSDQEFGGFLTRLDRRGRRLDDREKVFLMQVRMIASLAIAHGHGLVDRGYLDLAHRGFDFVVEHMWDETNGGFYFSVDRTGKPKVRRKNTDFHAYALTAFSEYYRISRRPAARAWAERVFDLLMEQAADGDLGFVEDFDGGDWPALNSDQMNLGTGGDLKTIDMHTNMLEGLMYLAGVTQAPKHRAALRNLLRLIVARGIHPEYGCTITAFDREWRPAPDARGEMTTSYGINVELAWIILAAADVLGEPRERYREVVLGLIDHALAYGFDHMRGGVAAYGPTRGNVVEAAHLPENRLLRAWWEQAEMLIALSETFHWTGDRQYLEAFLKLFAWVWDFQIDHECGDWYQEVSWPDGAPITTDKGGEWKTAFHVSRALTRTAKALGECLPAEP
ncbi:MAG: AGE family epimerase/isomerase [Candidatus Hydrogenedentes bacterium]|nr:AGE family epimerase/isomerase [Candidatus Hydrogenedentota bacterium]